MSPGRVRYVRARRATKAAQESAGYARFRFNSKIYGARDVRAALDALFEGKCAYCEHSVVRSGMDVEHYRPKGRVAESETHPGYYWLAYRWSNLLPACKFCNQRRKPPPVWGLPDGGGTTGGKADHFPLRDEAARACSPSDDIRLEAPLIIDPTRDHPSRHLTFNVNGEAEYYDDRGDATIKICRLNLRRLKDLRRGVIDQIKGLYKIEAAARRFPPSADRRSILDEVKTSLRKMTDNSAPFAGAARAVLARPAAFGL